MKPGPGRSSHLLALQEHAHNTKTRRSRPFPGSQCNASESAMLGGLSLTSQYITNKIKLLLTACPGVYTEVSDHGYFWNVCIRFRYLTVESTFHNLHDWVAARNFSQRARFYPSNWMHIEVIWVNCADWHGKYDCLDIYWLSCIHNC